MNTLANALNAQADALEAQAAVLRALALDAAKSSPSDMIDQTSSPLGNRRHCAAVQRRVSKGLPGASIVGRKHYLSPDALEQELAQAKPAKARRTAPANDVPTPIDELDRKLKLLTG